MSNGQIDRRRVLTFGAATALGAWSGLDVASATAVTGQQPDTIKDDDVLHFSATIPGLPEASKNIREIAIDENNIDARESRGDDQELWHVKPGSVHFGSATFTITGSPGASKELRAWFQEAAKGKNIRKTITVTLRKLDDKTDRVYNLVGCFPTSWSNVNFDTSSTVQSETLTVKVGRVEFKT